MENELKTNAVKLSPEKDINYNDSFLVDNWDVIQWKNTGLTSGKTYYYKVRCYVKYGNERRYTAYSSIVSVKVS